MRNRSCLFLKLCVKLCKHFTSQLVFAPFKVIYTHNMVNMTETRWEQQINLFCLLLCGCRSVMDFGGARKMFRPVHTGRGGVRKGHSPRANNGTHPAPFALKICSKSCSLQAIFRENPLLLNKFWAQAPLGSKLCWAPTLTKILDPHLRYLYRSLGVSFLRLQIHDPDWRQEADIPARASMRMCTERHGGSYHVHQNARGLQLSNFTVSSQDKADMLQDSLFDFLFLWDQEAGATDTQAAVGNLIFCVWMRCTKMYMPSSLACTYYQGAFSLNFKIILLLEAHQGRVKAVK